MNRRTFITYSLIAYSTSYASPKIKPWNLGTYGEFYFKQMHKNVYVMHGVGEHPNDDNMHFVHNVVLIEAKNGLIVIDPGSYEIGHNILEQIKRVSAKPIIALFNTHDHHDHWFANAVFKKAYPKVRIYAHKRMESAAKELYGGQYKHRGFTFETAEEIVFADITVDDAESITIDSEKFFIQHPNKAHTNNDIAITHLNSNTIIMGDLLFEKTLAHFGLNASIYGNIEFLKKVNKQKEYDLYIPGHGLSGTKKKTFMPYFTFMTIVQDEVQKAYDNDVEFTDLSPIKQKVISRLEWNEITGFSYTFLDGYIAALYDEILDRDMRSEL